MKMKLLCRQCAKVNRYTIWEIINEKGFICDYCDFYMEKNIWASRIKALLIGGSVGVGVPILDYYILEEISSKPIRFVLIAFIIVGIFFTSLPVIAFFMCFINNCITRRKHKKTLTE